MLVLYVRVFAHCMRWCRAQSPIHFLDLGHVDNSPASRSNIRFIAKLKKTRANQLDGAYLRISRVGVKSTLPLMDPPLNNPVSA